MANIKSQKKRIITNEKSRMRNRAVKSELKTATRRVKDAVAAGKSCRDIDAIARNYIYSHGYEGRFGHGLGHSVGIDIHEAPL